MQYISKADLDSVLGANLTREDISDTVSLLTTRPRPVTQYAPKVKATNTVHKWIEQPRATLSLSSATYAEGALPGTNAVAANKPTNKTCHTGLTAQVTDDMAAEWTGAGSWKLADGEGARMLQQALDYEVELVTLDVLDAIELMHIQGDQTNPGSISGGQTDGLIKWITGNSGVVVATGGTTGTPVNMAENFIKDGARSVAENYTPFQPDTMLVPPELIPDINSYIANGAGRPVNVSVNGKDQNGVTDLVAGVQVGYYNTGFSTLRVRLEPYLSPLANTALSNPAVILYKADQVKHASLVPLGAEPLARTDTSVKKMVTCVYAQEHRVSQHAAIIQNVKSAVS